MEGQRKKEDGKTEPKRGNKRDKGCKGGRLRGKKSENDTEKREEKERKWKRE